jgi:putative membrane protein (TIGR04086 family)
MSIGKKIGVVIRGLIISYAVTGLLLAALALAVYKLKVPESVTDLAIIAIYVAVTFLGAFVVGKRVKEQKFLLGLLLGILYIGIITLATVLISHTFSVPNTANITTAFLCVGGGLLGGMLS